VGDLVGSKNLLPPVGGGWHCTHGTSLAVSTIIVCTVPGMLRLLLPPPPVAIVSILDCRKKEMDRSISRLLNN
jgi:hypothetical protein